MSAMRHQESPPKRDLEAARKLLDQLEVALGQVANAIDGLARAVAAVKREFRA